MTLSGRENLFEPYIYSIFYQQGRWDPAPLVDRICSGAVGMLVLDHPIERDGLSVAGEAPYWPRPVLSALRQAMAFEGHQAGRYVYVRRPGPAPLCSS